jgi:hypothetical protein
MKTKEILGRIFLTLIGLFIIFMGLGVTMPLHNGYETGHMGTYALYMGMSATMIFGFWTIFKAWDRPKVIAVDLETQGLKPNIPEKSKYPIKLDASEVEWIKFCKGHYKDKYRTNSKNWVDSMKPMFLEKYEWSPDEYYLDFLDCMFKRLLDIYLKIADDRSGHNVQLKEIIQAGFDQTYRRDYALPIERVIAELCGQIQCNTVIEDGVERYKL